MSADSASFPSGEYLNPVYPHSFPDPFVLKFRGEYFAYCTDFWRDGRVFGVLRSRDLVAWTEVGGAMEKLANDSPFYWAPEVTYSNGRFYLYYSVGNEAQMEIRVAVSDRPEGGFIDAGKKLTTEEFAIDGHVFTDTDAQRYFFYATDFLSHSHIGTGTVVDKMVDLLTLESSPRAVTRARYDWQVYDPNRADKGGVRWHTVEGAFVLKRKGLYFEMFSGGNWQNVTYGVSFATTDDITRDAEWTQFSDGDTVLPILRTSPERIIGPGHNSVVRGPNNRELFCVYHRWTENGRALAIDRMDFVGARLFVSGATDTPQIAPFPPSISDYFDDAELIDEREIEGAWTFSGNEAVSAGSGENQIVYKIDTESFLAEFYVRSDDRESESGEFGFGLLDAARENLRFAMVTSPNKVVMISGDTEKVFELPADFDPASFHLLRVEVDRLCVRIRLDDANFQFDTILETKSNRIALWSRDSRAVFSAFSLTGGFEDLFDRDSAELLQRGWQKMSEDVLCLIEDQELYLSSRDERESILTKTAVLEDFEFAVNLRLAAVNEKPASFGVLLFSENDAEIRRFSFEGEAGRFLVSGHGEPQELTLPKVFAPENCHQFRFLRKDRSMFLQFEGNDLGTVTLDEKRVKIGVFCRNSTVAFDMVRLTVL